MKRFYAGCVCGFAIGWSIPKSIVIIGVGSVLILVAWGLVLFASSRTGE